MSHLWRLHRAGRLHSTPARGHPPPPSRFPSSSLRPLGFPPLDHPKFLVGPLVAVRDDQLTTTLRKGWIIIRGGRRIRRTYRTSNVVPAERAAVIERFLDRLIDDPLTQLPSKDKICLDLSLLYSIPRVILSLNVLCIIPLTIIVIGILNPPSLNRTLILILICVTKLMCFVAYQGEINGGISCQGLRGQQNHYLTGKGRAARVWLCNYERTRRLKLSTDNYK